ncbi:MAG: permease, partial [Kiritimatiellae bacterium]|nr:permease [Kiritimatiellia bacterium]
MNTILEFCTAFWNVFAMMAPWLIIGFFIAGIIAVCLPRDFVMRFLGTSGGIRSIVRAVMIGVPLPICSCGVIPISTALRKNGASKGATAGFLISTPQTGIDSILATYALMGPLFAIARPIAAFVTGLAGGCAVHALSNNDALHSATNQQSVPPPRNLRTILWQGYIRLLGGIVKPLSVGLVVSTLVAVLVPDDFFASTLAGRDYLAMPIMALIGFPMYICSTAAIPIAAALMMKGLSPGAAFVFLMTGPAVNAVSITTIASLIGKRATFAYIAVIFIGAILSGAIVNLLSGNFEALSVQCTACSTLPMLKHLAGIILAFLMVNAYI